MYVILTRVKLKPNTHTACAQLFQDTNPALVQDHPNWLGARMMFDAETQIVTVAATWRTAAAYQALNQSPAFQSTMQKFADFFAGPPDISVNTLLVDMAP